MFSNSKEKRPYVSRRYKVLNECERDNNKTV